MGEILAKIIADPPLRVRGVDASLASALDDFFERALAKQPEERFQTARELAHALARVAELDASEISLVLHERAESADEGTLGSATRVESSAVADDTTEGLAQPTVHDAVRPRRWKLPLMLGAAAALALSLSLSLSREDAARATSRLAQVPAARSMPVEPAPLSLEPAPHVEPAPTVAPKADKPPPMRKRPTRAPEAPPPAQPPSSEPPPPSRDLFSTPKG